MPRCQISNANRRYSVCDVVACFEPSFNIMEEFMYVTTRIKDGAFFLKIERNDFDCQTDATPVT